MTESTFDGGNSPELSKTHKQILFKDLVDKANLMVELHRIYVASLHMRLILNFMDEIR